MESLKHENLQIKVSSKGAELVSLRKSHRAPEMIWQADKNVWARSSPVLFPVVGKCNKNRVVVNNIEYSMPQHGFARDMEFELIEKTENLLAYSLKANEATLKMYPFLFELEIGYHLIAGMLTVLYKVSNHGSEDMPFCLGAHPGFNLVGGQFKDHSLEFEKQETAERHLLKEGLFTGETESFLKGRASIELDKSLFDKDAVVLKNLESDAIRLTHKKEPVLEMRFAQFPYFGIWSKPGHEEFICLEPWQGLADKEDFDGTFFEKEGVVVLPPGEERSFRWSIKIF